MDGIIREACGCCQRSIYFGQSISMCFSCGSVIHTRCFKNSGHQFINNKQYCQICCLNVEYIYNPFNTSNYDKADSDKFYDENLNDEINDLHFMQSLLENCNKHVNVQNFNDNFLRNFDGYEGFSSICLNLDGNSSNFDTFNFDISRINHKFSVIGLIETNTEPENKDLYMIDGYTSYYQNIMPDKMKGTGVALYVHNSLTATVSSEISHTSSNLESIFVSISIDSELLTIGAVYRPPSGNFEQSLNELKYILTKIPSNKTYIMGDFNADLHKLDEKIIDYLRN